MGQPSRQAFDLSAFGALPSPGHSVGFLLPRHGCVVLVLADPLEPIAPFVAPLHTFDGRLGRARVGEHLADEATVSRVILDEQHPDQRAFMNHSRGILAAFCQKLSIARTMPTNLTQLTGLVTYELALRSYAR